MDIESPSSGECHTPECHLTVRANARDNYAGLKGHDYIKARGLGKLVQTSAQQSDKENPK